MIKEDIRIETSGQWTRGMCVIDRRSRRKRAPSEDDTLEIEGDSGGWLHPLHGNRIRRMVGSPGDEMLAEDLLGSIFTKNV